MYGVSRTIPRCFWFAAFITLLLLLLLLLNTCEGCNITLDFRLKMTSCACFFGSGLKAICNWKIHLSIFAKSLFSSRAEALLSKITENKGVSSTNSLAFENYPSNKLLIYIKNNNNGPSLEPLITLALTSDQLETCPFNKTLCFLFLRRSHKRFSKLPDIPFCIVYIYYIYIYIICKYIIYNIYIIYISSVKWSNPGHFLKSQGKIFLSFPCILFFNIFDI